MPILGHGFHKEKCLASQEEVFDLAHPLISHAIRCFGQYRVIFATNFPMNSVSTSLVNIIDAFSDAIVTYHPDTLELVFRRNAKQLYQLE